MVYVSTILSFLAILGGLILCVAAIEVEMLKTPALYTIAFAAMILGAYEMDGTIKADQLDRKENKTLTEYCHPSRAERIVIEKYRVSVTLPYKTRVTVLPDRRCLKKGKRRESRTEGHESLTKV